MDLAIPDRILKCTVLVYSMEYDNVIVFAMFAFPPYTVKRISRQHGPTILYDSCIISNVMPGHDNIYPQTYISF